MVGERGTWWRSSVKVMRPLYGTRPRSANRSGDRCSCRIWAGTRCQSGASSSTRPWRMANSAASVRSGHAELRVHVLEVGRDGPPDTPSASAISGLDRPRASWTTTSASRGVKPAGQTGAPAHPVPGGGQDGVGRVAVEAAGRHLVAQHPLGRRCVDRRAVRPRLAQPVVDVGGGQDAGATRDGLAGQPLRVAGPVEALVVRARRTARSGRSVGVRASIRSVRYGCDRARSRWLTDQRPGSVHTVLDTPMTPTSCSQPARRTRVTSAARQTEERRGVAGERGDAAAVPGAASGP